jgi:hypothetical protein
MEDAGEESLRRQVCFPQSNYEHLAVASIPELMIKLRYVAGGYIVLTTLIVASIVRTFLYLLLLPSSHCSPPAKPLSRSITTRSIPLACSPAQPLGPVSPEEPLDLDRCHKILCKGVWKTGRTRHCSVCKRCRVGFDHHCPWVSLPSSFHQLRCSKGLSRLVSYRICLQ